MTEKDLKLDFSRLRLGSQVPRISLLQAVSNIQPRSNEFLKNPMVDRLKQEDLINKYRASFSYGDSSPQTTGLDKVVLSVDQHAIGFINGPHQDIGYIGTFGVANYVGVTVVRKIEGEPIKVGVAHIDSLTKVVPSVGHLMYELSGQNNAPLSVYVNTSQMDTDLTAQVLSRLEDFPNAKIILDSQQSRVAVDLSTGELVSPLKMQSLSWRVKESDVELEMMMLSARGFSGPEAASLQFNFERGVVPRGKTKDIKLTRDSSGFSGLSGGPDMSF